MYVIFNRGVSVKIFPQSDLISLPLAATIAGTIADYLRLMTQELYATFVHSDVNIVTGLSGDNSWQSYFDRFSTREARSMVRQVHTSQYQYVSTIAHRLAAKSALTPQEICQRLKLAIAQVSIDTSDSLVLSCWYNDAGYLYFQLPPESISKWLNYIRDLPLVFDLKCDRSLASVNVAIYAHARCRSLLTLAGSERVIAITANWSISDVNCLENQPTAELSNIFEEPAEHQLIHAFMGVLDGIYHDDRECSFAQNLAQGSPHDGSSNWPRLTIGLATSWLEFYRHCRMFGDVQRKNPRLAIARCGLTDISRRYLQLLLENYLGISTSIEL
jgi:hypothetical protein